MSGNKGSQKKEQIEGFNEAYKKAKELGFENYFIGVNANILVTWKDIKTMIDFKIKIPKKQRENIELNLKMFFKAQENKKLIIKLSKELQKKNA